MMSGRSSVAFVVRLKSISLPGLGRARPRVRDRRLQHREIEERLAAEKGHVRRPVRRLSRSRKSTLSRAVSSLMNFACLPCGGIDDLVLAVLITVGARQVALVRHVQHHRVERERHHRQHPRGGGLRLLLVADCANVDQLADRRSHGVGVEAIGQRVDDAFVGRRRFGYDTKHGGRRRVEREYGGARHQVQETLAGGLKR